MTELLAEQPTEALVPLEAPSALIAARVDLLPPEVGEQRAVRRLGLALGAGVVACALGVGGLYVQAGRSKPAAEQSLQAAQTQSAALQRQLTTLAQVKTAQQQLQSAQKALVAAMGDEVLWSRYMDEMRVRRPDGLRYTSVAITPVGGTTSAGSTPGSTTPGSSPAAGAASPAATVPGAIASLTISGKAVSQDAVADLLDALAQVPGYAAPYLSSTMPGSGNDLITFTVTVSVTPDALSHRYGSEGTS
jgi:Tfp pilus assembly protein PilN